MSAKALCRIGVVERRFFSRTTRLAVGKVLLKELKGGARCTAKAINGLVRISDREDVSILPGEASKNLNLGEVRVLKFVGEDEAGSSPRFGQNSFVTVQQGVRASDHVAERAQIFFPEPALHGGEYVGYLAAAAEHLGIVQDVLRLGNARNGNFLALQAFNVLRVFLGRDQFVVTAAHKVQQVVQELRHICSADVVYEMQIPEAAAQVDPEIFVVQDSEIFVHALEQVEAVIVEGGCIHHFAAQQLAHPVAHFFGSVIRVGESEDLVGLSIALANQTLNAVRQD